VTPDPIDPLGPGGHRTPDGRQPTGFSDDARAALAVVVAAVIAVAIRTARRVRRRGAEASG